MTWNPDKYHQFQSQRNAPFYNLLTLVDIRPNLRVVDLGCGTGELTSRLADALPGSDVLGIDSSPDMLVRSQPRARPGLRFELGDQAKLKGQWDLIFSNAALHWSENHQALIPFLWSRLAKDGQLAVQVPSNHHAESQLAIVEIARRQPFRSALNGWTRQSPVLPIDAYADLLFRLEAREIVVFEKVYPHVLENADAVLDWISGTTLLPYFERLGDLKDHFVDTLRTELRSMMPDSPVFYPFRRTFFSARKDG